MVRPLTHSGGEALRHSFDLDKDGKGALHTISDNLFTLDPISELSIRLLGDILIQQRITNMHLATLSGEEIDLDDIGEVL